MAETERVMKKRFVCVLLFLATLLCPLWSQKVLGTATLTITLCVPAPPVTSETEAGEYSGYEVAKTADTVYVTAV